MGSASISTRRTSNPSRTRPFRKSLLKTDSALKLLVVGHTNNVGSLTSNMTIFHRRAEAVVTALVSRLGVDKNRLTPIGVSFACPVAPNTNDEGRARNRRVELVKN